MPQIERTIEIATPLPTVFAFATDIRNHGRIAPPETHEQLLYTDAVPLRLGTVVTFRARYAGLSWTLTSRITDFDPPEPSHPDCASFRDEQVRGPFAAWRHDHCFVETPDGGTRLTDRFTYTAPLGLLGRLIARLWLNRCLRRLMAHLQDTTKQILETKI